MKLENLVVGKTYWCQRSNEPVVLMDNKPEPTFGLVHVIAHPSTGKCPENGVWPMAWPDQLRELTPLEMELL